MSRLIFWRKDKAKPAANLQAKPPMPAADDKATSPVLPPSEPPDLGKVFQNWVWKRFGKGGVAVLAVVGLLWSQWDHVKQLPVVDTLVARFSEQSLPRADAGKFNIAIAHLAGDDDHSGERAIRASLVDEFPIAHTMLFDRLIDPEQGESEGHERARALLKDSGFDVMVWGECVKQKDGSCLPRLSLTVARDKRQAVSAGRYQTTADMNLPPLFWHDLTDVLGLLVATTVADLSASDGHYEADKLDSFIQRVRKLLEGSQGDQWNPGTRAKVQLILGVALITYGAQSGRNEPLQEAVSALREVLRQYTREKVPLDWAMTQNNLGNAYATLGERESDPARLEQAVAAFDEALKEFTREKVPLDWAATESNLGSGLGMLGEREVDPGRLQEAVTAYREALKEFTREKLPLEWAGTQSNLGNVLQTLGGRESDPARLQEAVTAYREALKVRTREKVPLDWAATQNNLGNAFKILGERESDPAPLEEAVNAFREALKEVTREKVPLRWAETENNLGSALAILGERESDPARLQEAVSAYREALKEFTREKVPLEWAMTQNNLGSALETLGQRESEPARLEEAVSAYNDALAVFREANADYFTQLTERNLRRVENVISQEKNRKVAHN